MVQRGALRVGLPGGGTWAHVGEVARAHVAAADTGRSGERYLLGGPYQTYLDVLRTIGTLTGKSVPTRPMAGWLLSAVGQVSEWGSYLTRKAPVITAQAATVLNRAPYHFSSDKAVRELGYRIVSVEEMLREACTWLRSEGLLTS
jgi:nucleoside-diphosphate-sugar epimerase